MTGQEGMGGGDIKMLAMVGAFLGWQAVLLTLVLASLAGALVGVLIMATRRGGMKFAVPFGTFLAVGALTASLVGPPLT
jgi:leader peptidase (prepilin peptidase)/N-methyltransferase